MVTKDIEASNVIEFIKEECGYAQNSQKVS